MVSWLDRQFSLGWHINFYPRRPLHDLQMVVLGFQLYESDYGEWFEIELNLFNASLNFRWRVIDVFERNLYARAILYAEKRREGERCGWRHGKPGEYGGPGSYQTECKMQFAAGERYEFCQNCGKRIEVTP